MPDYAQIRQSYLRRNLQWADKNFINEMTKFKSDKEEEEFQSWLQTNRVPFDPHDPFPDYDMRGFYQALKNKDPKATSAIDPNDKRLHYPDYWKTPYHETFSKESKWAKKGAPAWNEKDQLVAPSGQILFDDRAQNYAK